MESEIVVYSAGAIRRGVDAVAALAGRLYGLRVSAVYGSAPKIVSRIRAGETADVVIVPDESLDRLQEEGRIAAEGRVVVGTSRMAIVLRAGARETDFSSADKLKAELLQADAVVHNEGSSGAAAASLIDDLGIRRALGDRLSVVPDSAEMMRLVTSGAGTVIGLAQGTNALDHIGRGTQIVIRGHFPPELSRVTTYEAALARTGPGREAAASFMLALTSSEGRTELTNTGLES
jgi:molybdate transport system substrate-binding protein